MADAPVHIATACLGPDGPIEVWRARGKIVVRRAGSYGSRFRKYTSAKQTIAAAATAMSNGPQTSNDREAITWDPDPLA